MKKLLVAVAVFLLFALLWTACPTASGQVPDGVAVAGSSDSDIVLTGGPGKYAIHTASNQQVMRTYRITTMDPEDRSNVEKAFQRLLQFDGRDGGSVEVAKQMIDGAEVTLLIVSATPAMQESIAQAVEEINVGAITQYIGGYPTYLAYKPKYRQARALAAAIEAEVTSEIGIVHVDDVANIVTVEDEPFVGKWIIEEVLPAFDVPPPQAQVMVRAVEMEQGNGSNVGVNWNAFQQTLPRNVDLSIGTSRLDGDSGLHFNTLDAVVSGISPQALGGFLEFMRSKGKARIMMDTTITVVNVEPATLEAGVRRPYTAIVDSESGNKEIRNQGQESILDGVTLSITGSLAEVGRRLNITAAVNSVIGWTANGLPVVSTSNVTATINIADGKSIVISGLKRCEEVETVHRTGLISKKKIKEKRERDVLIILHVLNAKQEESLEIPRLPSEACPH